MWHRIFMSSTIAAVLAVPMGCGPNTSHDDEPPGMLEYETPNARFYRLDRRVDIVGVDPMCDRSGCGMLTERAYDDLMSTLDVLDSGAEYDWPDGCPHGPPDGLLYLDGFEYSPFECSWWCSHVDLQPIAVVYLAVGSALYDQTPNINGEPYVALEPDMPCPD
jgi:hypothetical protein